MCNQCLFMQFWALGAAATRQAQGRGLEKMHLPRRTFCQSPPASCWLQNLPCPVFVEAILGVAWKQQERDGIGGVGDCRERLRRQPHETRQGQRWHLCSHDYCFCTPPTSSPSLYLSLFNFLHPLSAVTAAFCLEKSLMRSP